MRNKRENRASLHENLSPVRGEFQSSRPPVPKLSPKKTRYSMEMRRKNFDSRRVDSAENAICERQNSPLNNVVLCLCLVAVIRPAVAAPATLFYVYSAQREQPFNGFMIRHQEMQYLVYA